MREGLKSKFTDHMKNGITPACAGRTLKSKKGDKYDKDHPRMCGKDYLLLNNLARNIGSPPHVREGHFDHSADFSMLRITPACAGRTVTISTVRILV